MCAQTEEAIWRVLLLNFRLALLWLKTNHILLERCGESRLSSQGPLFQPKLSRLYSGEPQGGTVDISCIRACFLGWSEEGKLGRLSNIRTVQDFNLHFVRMRGNCMTLVSV